MILVFDTSVLIDVQRGNRKTIGVLRRISKEYPYPSKITVFNYFEFILGVMNKNLRKKDKAISLINNFDILNTTNKSAQMFAELKKKYDTKGSQIPLMDLLIAGLVIENNLTLITKDRDFEKIKELKKIII